MRGVDVTVPSRTYPRDVRWLRDVADMLSSDKRRGVADAVSWARGELDRLRKQVLHLEIDRAALLRQVKQLQRDSRK